MAQRMTGAGERITRPVCDETDKVCYTSKHDARTAMVGAMGSKSIRVYICSFHPSHWHVTKDWKNKRNR